MQKPWYDAYQVFAKPLLIETMEKRLILDRNIPSDWLSKWHRMLCSLFSVDSLNSLSFHFRTHMYKYGHVWAQLGWYAWMLIRTLVGPPLATRNLGSLALRWVWRVCALWPTFHQGGRKGGQVKPPAPFQTFQPPGADELLCEETAEACAWPRSGLASLLV